MLHNHSTNTYVLDTGDNTFIKLVLDSTEGKTIGVTITAGGTVHSWRPGRIDNAREVFIKTKPEEMASKFDTFNALRHFIEGPMLVVKVRKDIAEKGLDLTLNERAGSLVSISNISGLVAAFNDLMTAVYGFDWVETELTNIVGKSQRWLDLVNMIKAMQEALASS